MKQLGLAVLALLLGASAVALLSAGVTAMSSGPAVASPVQPVDAAARTQPAQDRVLLAQYDNDDDDDDDPPQRSRGGGYRGDGGGGINLNGLGNIIVPLIREGMREGQRQRQQQQYNEQIQRQRQQQQIIKNQQAAERKKRQAEEARIKRLRAEQKKLEDLYKKNQNRPQPAPYQPPTVYPNQPQQPQYVTPVVPPNDPNPVHPDDNCPDNFQQLRVGQTVLNPYRTDYPADGRVCTGTTARGCYLRVMNGPPACGSKPTCVMHCPPQVVVPLPPKPPVQPVCAYPPCGPQPQPVPNLVCTNPPCGPVATPSTPAEWTFVVTPKIEPQPPATPAVPTHVVTPKIEPQPPATPAVPTHVVTPKIEPQPPATPAVPTHVVTPRIEPQPPATPAVPTHVVTPKIEPDPPKTPAVPTHVVAPQVEPDLPKTPAVPTHVVTPKIELPSPTKPEETIHAVLRIEGDQSTTRPVPTHLVRPETEPVPRTGQPKPERTPLSEFTPYPKDKPRIEPLPPPADFGFDDATGPVCTPQGGPAVPQLKLDPQIWRTIDTAALGAIPVVGGPLSALAKALWKDTTSDSLFDQMKHYVDTVVPELLAKEFAGDLERKVKGIQKNLRSYDRETDPVEKAADLNYLCNALDTFEPDFIDQTHPPDRTIAHFAAFGALKLAVLKERLDRARPQQRADRQQDLDDAIKLYRDHAKSLKDKLAEKRIAGLKVTPHCTYHRIFRHSHTTCRYTADDPACGWSSNERDSEDEAKRDLDARRAAVAKAYSDTLDTVLAPLTAMAFASQSAPAASGLKKQ